MCRGLYAQQLSHWLQHYELGRTLLVVRFERFSEDRAGVLADVTDFLRVPRLQLTEERAGAVLERSYSPNRRYEATHEPLGNATLPYLRRFYRPYNDELADLLGEEWRNVWD